MVAELKRVGKTVGDGQFRGEEPVIICVFSLPVVGITGTDSQCVAEFSPGAFEFAEGVDALIVNAVLRFGIPAVFVVYVLETVVDARRDRERRQAVFINAFTYNGAGISVYAVGIRSAFVVPVG